MSEETAKFWWEQLPAGAGGDVIIGEIGEGAKNVAVGKGIIQTVHEVLGEPAPEDEATIDARFADLTAAIEALQGQLDGATLEMAKMQAELLKGELTKTGEDQHPSASTITKVGDWLLDNLPDLAEVVTSIFATPAVGRVVGKAGNAAVDWVKGRLGGAS